MQFPILAAGIRFWVGGAAPAELTDEAEGDRTPRLHLQLGVPAVDDNRPNGKPVLHLVQNGTPGGAA